MARQCQTNAIVQRADHYETRGNHKLRKRAVARVRALRNSEVVTDGGAVACSGTSETTVESAYTRHIHHHRARKPTSGAEIVSANWAVEIVCPTPLDAPNAPVRTDEFRVGLGRPSR